MDGDYSDKYQDFENDTQREAWAKAKEHAMNSIKYDDPELEWEDSYVEVEIRAIMEFDGISADSCESFDVDLSDNDISDIVSDYKLEDQFNYDDLREEVAEHWADEHWEEYMPEDKRSEEEIELEGLEEKIKFLDESVDWILESCQKLDSIRYNGRNYEVVDDNKLSGFFISQSHTMLWKVQTELSEQRDILAQRRAELKKILEDREKIEGETPAQTEPVEEN